MKHVVHLTEVEMAMVRGVAKWRFERASKSGFGPGHGEERYDHDSHFIGATGECAFAKFINEYWDAGQNDFGKDGDVANLEVRSTMVRKGHLIVFPTDPDDRCMILVITDFKFSSKALVNEAHCEIRGWIRAGSAKKPDYIPGSKQIRDGSPLQYWVPQSDLESAIDLRPEGP